MTDTIAAIATGNNISAVGIVRISGPDAITASDNFFRTVNGISLINAETKRIYYGEFRSNNNNLTDICLCTVSKAPHSYTGENTVELYCHGSPAILSEILNNLFSTGIRPALPGEFTKRAFLNGKMDLTQAEAVIDLIEAETVSAASNAAGQLQGAISKKLESAYTQLLDIITHFHAVIDYPDEDIDEFEMQKYIGSLRLILNELKRLSESYKRGKILHSGIPAVIIGRPNTGKSSLFNAILGYDRTIVTDIAGTTRDTVEEKVLIGNILLRLIDTAGLRKTDDSVEKLGVDRTHAVLNDAGLVILVLDGSSPLTGEDLDAFRSIPSDIPKIAVINKSDLPVLPHPDELNKFDIIKCPISALSGEGLDTLSDEIIKLFPDYGVDPDGFKTNQGELITNARQAEAISRAEVCINASIASLTESVTPDAVLTDIEAALTIIGEITGKTVREDIISGIFDRFCVGK